MYFQLVILLLFVTLNACTSYKILDKNNTASKIDSHTNLNNTDTLTTYNLGVGADLNSTVQTNQKNFMTKLDITTPTISGITRIDYNFLSQTTNNNKTNSQILTIYSNNKIIRNQMYFSLYSRGVFYNNNTSTFSTNNDIMFTAGPGFNIKKIIFFELGVGYSFYRNPTHTTAIHGIVYRPALSTQYLLSKYLLKDYITDIKSTFELAQTLSPILRISQATLNFSKSITDNLEINFFFNLERRLNATLAVSDTNRVTFIRKTSLGILYKIK